jgi:hypothetical protein
MRLVAADGFPPGGAKFKQLSSKHYAHTQTLLSAWKAVTGQEANLDQSGEKRP